MKLHIVCELDARDSTRHPGFSHDEVAGSQAIDRPSRLIDDLQKQTM